MSAPADHLSGDQADRTVIQAEDAWFLMEVGILALSWCLYIALWKQAYLMVGYGFLALRALWWITTSGTAASGRARAWVPILAFYGFVALSSRWLVHPELIVSNYFLPSWLPVPLMIPYGFYAGRYHGTERTARILAVIFGLMIATTLYAVLVLGETAGERAGSLRTIIGEGLALSAPFVTLYGVRNHRPWAILALLIGAGVVLTLSSRTTLLTYPLVVAGTAWLVRRSAGSLTVSGVARGAIAVMASVLIVFFLLLASGQETATRIVSNGIDVFDYSDSSVSEANGPEDERGTDWDRRLVNFVAIESFLERPILGIGYQGVRAVTESEYGFPFEAHGLLGTILAELGIVGATLFAWVAWRTFRGFWVGGDRQFAQACTVAFGALLFHGFFHQLHDNWFFHLMLGIGASGGMIRRSGVAEPEMACVTELQS